MLGWLTELTDWIRGQVERIWDAVASFFKDVVIFVFESALDLVAIIVDAIPVPDFLGQYNLGTMLGSTGPTVLWVMGEFRIGEALGIIAAGYGFRILRKFLTLFQW